MKYPRIEQYGLKIDTSHEGSIPGIQWGEFDKLNESQRKIIGELLSGQTCGENGSYVYDVEAALERMESGKLTGTQLYWD